MKKKLSLVLATLMLLGLLAGCGGQPAASGDKDTVVVYIGDIFNSMTPYMTTANSDQAVFDQVYETLTVTKDDGTVAPCLAKSWKMSDDSLEYTFQLEEADQLRLSDLLPGANFADICTDGNILLDFLLCHTILRQMDLFGSSLASLYGGMHSKRDQYWSYFCVNEKSESLLCLRSFLSSRAVRFRGTAAISIPSTGAAGGRWPPWSGWRRHLPPPPKAPGPG